MDRAERVGLGVAVAGHVALFGLLGLTIRPPETPPAPPSVEVEFVDGAEVALQAQAAPAASQAPELAPEPAEAAAPEPIVAPVLEPIIQPSPAPVPTPAPAPLPKAQPQPRPQRQAPSRPQAQPKAAPRAAAQPKAQPKTPPRQATASRLGADFLKGIGSDPAPKAAASGAKMTPVALAGISQLIENKVRPCASGLRKPGPGAERIRTVLALQFRPNGSLSGTPRVVRQEGTNSENERFAEDMASLAVAAVRNCSPIQGLPAELYSTPTGGWKSVRFRYTHPG